MTIGPLRPDADSRPVDTSIDLKKSRVGKPGDQKIADQVRQPDRLDLRLSPAGGEVPRATYSLDEIMSGEGRKISSVRSESRSPGNERLEQIRIRINNGFYGREEILDEISAKIIERSQGNE